MSGNIVGIYGLDSIPFNNPISNILHALNNVDIHTHEYQYIKLTVIATYNEAGLYKFADQLNKHLMSGDSIIAHSYGCAIVYKALKLLKEDNSKVQLHNVYLFNAALNEDIVLETGNCDHIYLFNNEKDRLLTLATYLPSNIMGQLGKHGYKYRDAKITNMPMKCSGSSVWHHSCQFKGDETAKYADMIKILEAE